VQNILLALIDKSDVSHSTPHFLVFKSFFGFILRTCQPLPPYDPGGFPSKKLRMTPLRPFSVAFPPISPGSPQLFSLEDRRNFPFSLFPFSCEIPNSRAAAVVTALCAIVFLETGPFLAPTLPFLFSPRHCPSYVAFFFLGLREPQGPFSFFSPLPAIASLRYSIFFKLSWSKRPILQLFLKLTWWTSISSGFFSLHTLGFPSNVESASLFLKLCLPSSNFVLQPSPRLSGFPFFVTNFLPLCLAGQKYLSFSDSRLQFPLPVLRLLGR